ncbi:MAG: cytochrome c-type biogenesis protein CcmH [Candidatus Koribacter versatilis]|uniref:Cytochrome c-type biogenesis protein n=1 Tax=Candidatus Korobacter versatilis TaxID=658062 RepID=A0A932AA92_9BACT|nr:cytochrome c-type biogenesis protein CcmH [Candidatus Koribacter versatilis]
MEKQSPVVSRQSLASAISGRPSRSLRFKLLVRVTVIVLLALVFMGAGDNAQRFSTLGHGMVCPCGCSQILLECNHVGCQYSDRMRAELQAQLNAGDSDEAITQAFTQKYGNTILAAPTKTGFNLVAWIVPFLVLALATLFAGMVVRRWRTDGLGMAAAPAGAPGFDRFREQARRETEI